jgi:hypothetical protein
LRGSRRSGVLQRFGLLLVGGTSALGAADDADRPVSGGTPAQAIRLRSPASGRAGGWRSAQTIPFCAPAGGRTTGGTSATARWLCLLAGLGRRHRVRASGQHDAGVAGRAV